MAAREHDVPARSLVKDAVLLDLSRNPVSSVDKLAKVPGLPRRFAQAYGEAIVSATREALDLPREALPTLPPFATETPGVQVRVDALNALAANLCHARRIAPSLAVSRRDVAELYDAFTHDRRDRDQCRLAQAWRRELVGGPLVDVLQGRSSVRLWWTEGHIRAEVQGPDCHV
jgi:ribonuclease D